MGGRGSGERWQLKGAPLEGSAGASSSSSSSLTLLADREVRGAKEVVKEESLLVRMLRAGEVSVPRRLVRSPLKSGCSCA